MDIWKDLKHFYVRTIYIHFLKRFISESFLRRQSMIGNYRVKKFVRKSQLSKQTLLIGSYRVNHQELIQSKQLSRSDVLINLPKTDVQWVPEQWTFMPDPPFETFLTTHGLKGLRQKGCHILVKNWNFNDPFHKKSPVLSILVPVMIRP